MPTFATLLFGTATTARRAAVIQKLSPVSVYLGARAHVSADNRPSKGNAAAREPGFRGCPPQVVK